MSKRILRERILSITAQLDELEVSVIKSLAEMVTLREKELFRND